MLKLQMYKRLFYLYNKPKSIILDTIKRDRKKAIGAPPGTLIHSGLNHTFSPQVTVTIFSESIYKTEQISTPDHLPDSDTGHLTWVHIKGIHDVDLIKQIGERYEIPLLILEDILNTRQRTKYEVYDDVLFINQNLPYLDKSDESIKTEQVSLVVIKNICILFQERDDDYFKPIYQRIENRAKRLHSNGISYFTYAILDILIDLFYPYIDFYYDNIDKLETAVLGDADKKILAEIHTLKNDLIYLRKIIWPSKEILNYLLSDESLLFSKKTNVYFRDTYDHIIHIIEQIEHFKDLANSLTESYMNQLNLKLNETLKLLTIISTIFIPLSFIAGVYGMNFNTDISPLNMPELNFIYGYPIILFLMFMIAFGMLFYFRRKRWF